MIVHRQALNREAVLWAVAAGLLISVRVWIASHSEMVLVPSDSMHYVFYASQWFWGMPFLPERGPGLPVWMMMSYVTGIRFRMMQEVLFVTATAVAALALVRAGISRGLAFAFFAIVLLLPAADFQLAMPMADGFSMCLYLLLFAALVFLLSARRLPAQLPLAALSGAFAAIIYHTREEGVFLAAPLAFVLLWEFIAVGPKRTAAIAAATAALPVALTAAILWANSASFGYSGQTTLLSRSEQRLLMNLMRIDAGDDGPYAPISQKARELAYSASPQLAQWRSSIEDPNVLADAQAYTGVQGALDTQRYFVLLRRIGRPTTYPGMYPHSAKFSGTVPDETRRHEDLLNGMSAEIEAAFSSGRLRSRTAIHPYLSPVLSAWAWRLPSSAKVVLGLILASPDPLIDNQGYGLARVDIRRAKYLGAQ